MQAPKVAKAGDPCPQCEGPVMREVRAPTEKAYLASLDRENPIYLPAGVDTASPAFREEHGGLFVCDACGYRARIVTAPPVDAGSSLTV